VNQITITLTKWSTLSQLLNITKRTFVLIGVSLTQEMAHKRGLASASDETRERVAKAGGDAPHDKRGLQAASEEIRKAVAKKGGLARGEQRRKAREMRVGNESA
jgi:hypothetical protein